MEIKQISSMSADELKEIVSELMCSYSLDIGRKPASSQVYDNALRKIVAHISSFMRNKGTMCLAEVFDVTLMEDNYQMTYEHFIKRLNKWKVVEAARNANAGYSLDDSHKYSAMAIKTNIVESMSLSADEMQSENPEWIRPSLALSVMFNSAEYKEKFQTKR